MHLINRRLRVLLIRLGDENTLPERTAQNLSELMGQLRDAAERLPNLPSGNPESAKAAVEYHNHVKALSQILPTIQGRLMAERGRLEAQRSQMAGARAWAQASKHSL